MRPRPLLKRLSEGQVANVSSDDFRGLIERFGFRLSRIRGSHHIFRHRRAAVGLNVQEVKGEAKPYQIRQFLRLVEKYNFELEDEP